MAGARTKRLTLIACVLGTAVVFLDGTVVNVALPAIRDDLDTGLAAHQWVVEAYLLTLGALLLVGGSLGDGAVPESVDEESTHRIDYPARCWSRSAWRDPCLR